MKFLTPGQRIKAIRKQLDLKQIDLQGDHVKRNFVSMIENGERGLTKETARFLADRFNSKALELGICLHINEDFLLMSPEDEAREYYKSKLNSELTVSEIDKIIMYSKKNNLFDIEALGNCKLGEKYFDKKCYDEAEAFFEKSLNMYVTIDDKKNIAYLLNKSGRCKVANLFYSEALECFIKSKILSEAENDITILRHSTYNISICYRKMSKYNESIDYVDKYLDICDNNLDYKGYIYAMVVKACCYKDLKEYNKSFNIYYSLLEEFNANKVDEEVFAYVYENLGLLYSECNEYDKALEYLNLTHEIRLKSDIKNSAISLLDKASILDKKGDTSEALKLIKQGITVAKKYNDSEYELKGYYMLADIYKNNTIKLESIYLKIFHMIKNKKDYKTILNIINKLYSIYFENNDLYKAKELLLNSNLIN